jgi:hypothetical protein
MGDQIAGGCFRTVAIILLIVYIVVSLIYFNFYY